MPRPALRYPRLIEATARCPPEDVGGPWGYRDILDAIADPNNQEHAERLQWIGGRFDPAIVDTDKLTRAVAALAKRWSRKPTAKHNRTT